MYGAGEMRAASELLLLRVKIWFSMAQFLAGIDILCARPAIALTPVIAVRFTT